MIWLTKPLIDIKSDLGGSIKGTTTEVDFAYEDQTAIGGHKSVTVGTPCVIRMNLTHGEESPGIESRQAADDGLVNCFTVISENKYSQDPTVEWNDTTSEYSIIQALCGGYNTNVVGIEHAVTDSSDDRLVGYRLFGETIDPESNTPLKLPTLRGAALEDTSP